DLEPISTESRLNWFNEHNSSKRPLWVIEHNNLVVGWISFQSFYGRPAYDATVEVSIYLSPETRGRGIGKEALEFAINNATNLGINSLLAFIFSHNMPSINLFKKFGFEQWANLPNIAKLDNQERSLIILGKRIAD